MFREQKARGLKVEFGAFQYNVIQADIFYSRHINMCAISVRQKAFCGVSEVNTKRKRQQTVNFRKVENANKDSEKSTQQVIFV